MRSAASTGFAKRAYEGHHDPDVVETHLFANDAYGAAFEFEAGAETHIDVACRTAEPDHRILFGGFVQSTADQIGVFIGFEVREPHDHGLRCEGGRNLRDALGEFVDVEPDRVGISRHLRADFLAQRRIEAIECQQRARMYADHAVDDELEPGEPHATVRDAGEVEGAIRVADVHHDLDG